jgi:hypothetical protein
MSLARALFTATHGTVRIVQTEEMKYVHALALLCLPALVLASDSKWMEKDYTQWSTADVRRVLENSGWAKEATAFFGTTDEDARDFPVQSPSPRDAGMGGRSVSDGHWDGGVGRIGRGGTPTLPVIVRWDSALPVRQALLRMHDKGARDTERTLAAPDKYYVLSVVGLVRARQQMQATSADSPDTPLGQGRTPYDVTQTRQGLMNLARLYPKNEKAIVPADVRVDEETGSVQIYFPRSVPIEPKDKEVLFQITYGSIKVTQRFKLKDMMYRGKLEL